MNFILVANTACQFIDSDYSTESMDRYDSDYAGYTPSTGTWSIEMGFIQAKDVDGFTFLGWYTFASNGQYGKVGDATNIIRNQKTLTFEDINNSGKTYGTSGLKFICAKYSEKTYTITYKPGTGGSGSQQTQTKTHGIDATLKNAIFTRTGYTQNGWATSDGGPKVYDLGWSYQDNADLILFPSWTVDTYTITYKPGDGSGSQQTQTKTHDVDVTLKNAIFTRTGYTQNGWATSQGGPKVYDLGGNYSNNASMTLFPSWATSTYTITYKPGTGGSGSQQTQTKTHDVDVTLKNAIFTRTGYTQNGWSTYDGGPKVYDLGGNYSNNASMTLFPSWTTSTYTITYKPGDGFGSQQTQTKTHGVDVTLKNAIFTRLGYTQNGWATSQGGVKIFNLGENYSYNASMTLFPSWTESSYTVTFKDWNGSTLKTQTVNHGSNATPPANPTRNGYTFSRWNGSYTNVTSDRTITAEYTPNMYTITLNTNGGTIASGNVTQYFTGSGATLPTNVTKTGYTFDGWYANEDLTGSRVTSIGTSDYGNKTFWAKWSRNWYYVTLNTNGGTINKGNIERYRFGDGATLPTDVTRTGYAFGGWFAESDFSGDRVYDIGPDEIGEKTFYAKWANEFTVTFEDHDGTVLKTEEVPDGGDATPPDDPVREGYDFDGWDGDYTDVTSDRTITATYTVKEFTVTFKDFDGTVLDEQTVEFGSSATAPTNPSHTGYTFTGWSRSFTNVRENIEVFAVYEGASNYTIRGRRWQRLYTAAKATPVYAAESDASLAARTICNVQWQETSGNFVSCLTAHPGTAETDEHNLANREYFDAAAFCAGHENGMHRVYAQATCYRFALPASAEDKRMNTLKLVVSGDPYLRDGARIAVLTNDTGVIPTDCSTCRNGQDLGGGRHLNAPGVVPRTVSPDGTRWYGKTDTLQFTPSGGLTLGKYLFVFVILENYAYSRGEYVEGSACIQPNVEIGMAVTVSDWTTDGVNLCYENQSHSYDVCRGGIIEEHVGSVSGIQSIVVQRSGDQVGGTIHNLYDDSYGCYGLRSVYAALYEGRLIQIENGVALDNNAREGAGFVVRGDTVSIGGNSVKTWQLTTSVLFVPFAVPVSFRANKIGFGWAGWNSATAGSKFNVWLKRGTFVKEYPEETIKKAAIYTATETNVDGFELIGTIDAKQNTLYAEFELAEPLGGYVATIMLTAFISMDGVNPSSGMTLPQGVAIGMNMSYDYASMNGKGTGWKPSITLLG